MGDFRILQKSRLIGWEANGSAGRGAGIEKLECVLFILAREEEGTKKNTGRALLSLAPRGGSVALDLTHYFLECPFS